MQNINAAWLYPLILIAGALQAWEGVAVISWWAPPGGLVGVLMTAGICLIAIF